MLNRIAIIFLIIDRGYSQEKAGEICTDNYTNTIGRCVLANTCQSAKDDFFKNGTEPTFCTFNSLVCCRDGSNFIELSTPVPQNPSGMNKRISEKKCEEYSRSVTKIIDISSIIPGAESLLISVPKCNNGILPLIAGGINTEVGEFPHMVAIGWLDVADGYRFKCGGSLISERFVLTAGHCLYPTASVTHPSIVRLGDHNLDPTVDDGANYVDFPIKAHHVHPDFKSPKKYNDIGLIELEGDVKFEMNIRPACLWQTYDFDGRTHAVATGWGVMDIGVLETSKILQKVSLPLLSNEFCDNLLKPFHNRNWKGFNPTQMCAGDIRGGKDTCQGDTGGPLQFTAKKNPCVYYVAGITSFGIGCAMARQPGVYTRVSTYIDWIESKVWPGVA